MRPHIDEIDVRILRELQLEPTPPTILAETRRRRTSPSSRPERLVSQGPRAGEHPI